MKRNDSIHECLSLNAIKAYLNEEVSEQERSNFAKHFASCALCEEVRESFSTVNQMGVEEDVSDLQETVFETINQRKAATRRLFLSRIAAGILLPITAIAAYFYWNNLSNERLYEQHFQSYLILDTTDHRSGDGIQQYESIDLPQDLKIAIENYKLKNYKESLPYFKAYQKIQPQNTKANFYYALANLEIGNVDTAIPLLKKVRNDNTQLSVDATWYLALAMLKKKDKLMTKQLLEELKGSKFYSPKAAQLLNQL